MKAKILFYERDEEATERSERLGTPLPELNIVESYIYFDIDAVRVSYINTEGDIALHLDCGTWVIPFDADLWEKIIGKFTYFNR